MYKITMYCANCGSIIPENTQFCEYCGTEHSNTQRIRTTHHTSTIEVKMVAPRPEPTNSGYGNVSPKSKLAVILLWLFFGVLGFHYFYVGRIGMGLLWLLTGGFFGIGWIIDILVILSGSFKDSFGRPIVNL